MQYILQYIRKIIFNIVENHKWLCFAISASSVSLLFYRVEKTKRHCYCQPMRNKNRQTNNSVLPMLRCHSVISISTTVWSSQMYSVNYNYYKTIHYFMWHNIHHLLSSWMYHIQSTRKRVYKSCYNCFEYVGCL